MRSVAVIGGGISALSAIYVLKQKFADQVDIDIYSDRLGGEYLNGGLKYVLYTKHTGDIFDELGIDYELRKINGAVLHNGAILPYPDFLYKNVSAGINIQRSYWEKTRGLLENFDIGCMNSPWVDKIEIKINPTLGLSYLMKKLIAYTEANVRRMNTTYLNAEEIKSIVEKYDDVIYTIPIRFYFDAFNIKYDMEKFANDEVNIIKVESLTRMVWWDYLYITDANLGFHRISKNDGGMFDIESNIVHNERTAMMSEKEGMEAIENDIEHFFNNTLKMDCSIYKAFKIKLKGQIKVDFKNDKDIVDNVFLLGRFAQWNKRITFDKVAERINDKLIPYITNKLELK